MSTEPARSIVNDLRDESKRAGAISTAEHSLTPECAKDLLLALLDLERASSSEQWAIDKTMTFLEVLMEESPLLGAALMAVLYPLASDAFLHEVCNGIEFWIEDSREARLVEILQSLASGASDQRLARRYNRWVDSINARIS